MKIVEDFACQGLRTLAFAYREVPQGTDEDDMEDQLHLLGVTGVDDALQEDVSTCL